MSQYYKENGDYYTPVYDDGRTKQSFKDSTDINKILKKAQKVGSLSHLQKHGAVYGDFTGAPADLLEARQILARGEEIFSELPSEVRKDFDHDPLKYFAFVNDPANADRLEEVLPAIAEPGRYFPQVKGGAGEAVPADNPAPVDTPAPVPETPPEGG